MLLRQGRQVGRRAASSLWALFSLPVLLVALALALNAGWFGLARQELTRGADAAALAATGELVSDEWLRLGGPGIGDLLARAKQRAIDLAALNRVLGRALQLQPDDPILPDLVFGSFDPVTGAFTAADLIVPSSLTLDQVNSVAVFARRTEMRGEPIPVLLGPLVLRPTLDLQAGVVAYLDRDVIGFRALAHRPIPLVPLGIRSDPTSADPASWENQIVNRNGPDQFSYDTGLGFVAGPDGIPEIDVEVQLLPGGNPTLSNGYLVSIGTTPIAMQVTGGISADDLTATNGVLSLDANNQLLLPASALGPPQVSPAYTQLVNAFAQLRDSGAVRVFPLVSTANVPPADSFINAFVAARVVRIQEPVGGPLRIRLQPAMLLEPKAITDPARRGSAHLLPSPYIARTRLVR